MRSACSTLSGCLSTPVGMTHKVLSVIALIALGGVAAGGCASVRPDTAPASLVSSASTPAADRYTLASAAVGTSMRYDVSDGSTQTTETLRVLAAHPADGGIQLSVEADVTGKTARTLVYRVHPDGSESIPWDTALAVPDGWTLKVVSGEITVPAPSVLAAGTSQTSRLTLAESNGHETQDVLLTATTRGVGTQRVTVPAGTFDAQVVVQRIVEAAGSKQVDVDVAYWLVAGLSTVKAVETVTDATQTRTETASLRSITRPPPPG
jgi:hypothetical protein